MSDRPHMGHPVSTVYPPARAVCFLPGVSLPWTLLKYGFIFHPISSKWQNNNNNLPLEVRWLSRLLEPGRLFLESESQSLSHVQLFATSWPLACQAPLSMEFFRQEYWSGLPFPSPGDLTDSVIEHRSPALQADSLPFETPGLDIL